MQPSDRVNVINWNSSPVHKDGTPNKYEATWSNREKTYTITVGIPNGLSHEYVKNIIEEQFKEFKVNDMDKLVKNKFSYDPLKNDRESQTFSDLSSAADGKTEITLKRTENYFERLTGWITGMFSPVVEESDFTIEAVVMPNPHFELLPDEMIISMLMKLSVKEIVRMREVDTRFRDIGSDVLAKKISDENISLEELGLKGNAKVLAFLNSLHPVNRHRIRQLNLSGTGVDDEFLARLSSLTPNLQDLNLACCYDITNDGLKHLAPFTELRSLSLAWCSISNDGLPHLTSFKKLKNLSLAHCLITGAGLQNLAYLTQLRILNLVWCNIADEDLQHIGSFTQLRRLSLEGCVSITDYGLQHLAPLKKLVNLNLWFCYNTTYVGRNALKRHIPNLKFTYGV